MQYLRSLCCRFAFEGILQTIYGFDREELNCDSDEDAAPAAHRCLFRKPDDILRELDVEDANLFIDLAVLGSFFLGLRIACYFVLRWRVSIR